jgi:hypothetical protein
MALRGDPVAAHGNPRRSAAAVSFSRLASAAQKAGNSRRGHFTAIARELFLAHFRSAKGLQRIIDDAARNCNKELQQGLHGNPWQFAPIGNF